MSPTPLCAAVAAIAREELGIRTLDIRGSETQDFHDLHVSRIEQALTRGYRDCGVAAVNRIFTTHQKGDQQ